MANPAWSIAFPSAVLEHKLAASSDHVPILLKLRDAHACSWGPRAFKFELTWEREESLATAVRAGWERGPADSAQSLHDKLEQVAGDLSTWERVNFGNIRQEISRLKMQLQELRQTPGRAGPTHAEIKMCDRLVELYHREEILW